MPEVISATLTADQSQLEAEVGKARKNVEAYQAAVVASQGKALAAQNTSLDVLAALASGHKDEAAALQRKIALEAEVARMVQQTGMSEQAAMNVAKMRATLQEKIASRQAAAVRLPEISQGSLRTSDLSAHYQATEKVRTAHKEAEKAARGHGLGLLYIAQAADDAQYGMRGILNNIPQLVMGLGGTAGLAGAASIAVLALYGLGKLVGSVFNTDAADRAAKAAAAYRDAFKAGSDDLRHDLESIALKKQIIELTKEYATRLAASINQGDGVAKSIEAEIAARKQARGLAEELATAQANLVKAKGGQTDDLDAQRRQRELTDLEKDLKARQELVKRYSEEARRLNGEAADARAQIPSASNDPAADEEEKIRKRLVAAEATLAKRKSELETATGKSGFARDVGRAADRLKEAGDTASLAITSINVARLIDGATSGPESSAQPTTNDPVKARAALESAQALKEQLQKQLDTLKQVTEAQRTQSKESAAALAAAAKELDAKISANQKESESLRDLIEQRRQLAKIIADTAAEERARRERPASEISIEADMLQLVAQGHREIANSIREQIRQEKEARALAEATGVEYERAIRLVQERDAAQKAADAAPNRAATAAEIKALQEEAAGHRENAQAIRDEARQKREAIDVAKANNVTEKEALKIVQERDRLQKQIARAPAQREFLLESAALNAQLNRRKDLADALRKEGELRQRAHQLAVATGMTEAQALAAVRQRARQEAQIANQRRGGIRQYQGRFQAGGRRIEAGGRRISAGARPSLINKARRDREAQRTGADTSAAAAAAQFYERNLSKQDEIIKCFRAIGVF